MRKATRLAFAVAFCGASLFAQEAKIGHATGPVNPFVGVDPEPPAPLQKIYSNLGTGTNVYSGTGYLVLGPLSAFGSTQFVGMEFESKVAAHVEQVRAALQYYGSGVNQVQLSIYSDASGVPGTLLSGPRTVTNLPAFFTCCTLAMANFAPLAITAHTKYWVVADTPVSGTGSDFEGVWAWVPPLKLSTGINTGTSWFSVADTVQESAGAVYGTIP